VTSSSERSVVIDASFALKWQLDDEADTEPALLLRDDVLVRKRITAHAPTLFVYELTNGVVSALRRKRLDAAVGQRVLRNLLSVGVVLGIPALERTLELALEYELSAYDSSYVALAEQLGIELWTADRQLYDAVGISLPWVRWISDYSS